MASRKRDDPPLPPAFDPSTEGNPWLKRFKAARLPKWSFNSSGSLQDMGDLAAYLMALGRGKEAVQIGEAVAERTPFSGDFRIWSPANDAMTHAAYGALQLGDEARAGRLIAVLLAPGLAKRRSSYEQDLIESFQWIENAIDRSADTRLALITALRYLLLMLAAHRGRYPGSDWFPVDEIEVQVKRALQKLRATIDPLSSL